MKRKEKDGGPSSELSALRAWGEPLVWFSSCGQTSARRGASDARGQIHIIFSLHRNAGALWAPIVGRGCTRAKKTSGWPLAMLSTGTLARSCYASVDAEERHKVEVKDWILRGLEGRRRVRVWGRWSGIGGIARNISDNRVDHQIANNISEFRRRMGFLLLFLAIYVNNNNFFSQNI